MRRRALASGRSSVRIAGCVALVTGAAEGVGRGFLEALLEGSARRVYATARNPASLQDLTKLDPDRVVALKLDVTSAEDRRRAAGTARDVTLLINNAGISGSADGRERRFLAAASLDDARRVMETDFFAQAEICRTFTPALIRADAAAIINILSIGALFCTPAFATYSAAKAAAAMMTQGIRAELLPHGVLVMAVYTAGVRTRMSAGPKRPMVSPIEHAREVLAAVEAGTETVFAGAGAEALHAEFLRDPVAFVRHRVAGFAAALDPSELKSRYFGDRP